MGILTMVAEYVVRDMSKLHRFFLIYIFVHEKEILMENQTQQWKEV